MPVSWTKIIKKVLCSTILGLFGTMVCMPLSAQAATTPVLLIKSVSLGSTTDATDEFVILTNNGTTPQDIKGIEVEYKAAIGKTWSQKATASDSKTLAPGADIKLANKQAHDLPLTSGFAQAGGNLRIVLAGQTLDQLAWGTGDSPEGTVLAAPKAGQDINRLCETTKPCQDTNNNTQDFQLTALPSPATSTTANPSDPATEQAYEIELTELLPDPASPQTDAKDEFIELYNAGSTSATLTGWKLTSGKQSYKLDAVSLSPGQYIALTSAITKLGLTNTGDTVSLIDGAGQTVFTSPNYGAAKSGKSYGATPSGWGWLDHPTPNVANAGLYIEPPADNKDSAKTAKATAKKVASQAAKSPAKGKITAAKAAAKGSDNASANAADRSTSQSGSSISSGWVLAALGVFAIGYGVYEYRPELLSLYAQLRAKLGVGKKDRGSSTTSPRRRS